MDKNVVSDKALRTIGAVRRAGRFIMAGMDAPLYPDSNDENVWAHWSRGNYGPGDWSGSHNDLAAGVDLYHTDHSRAGISVMHTNSSLDRTENLGEVSMKKKFTRVSLYGCHDFAGGLHAAGDVFAGGIRIKDTSLVDMSTRTAESMRKLAWMSRQEGARSHLLSALLMQASADSRRRMEKDSRSP